MLHKISNPTKTSLAKIGSLLSSIIHKTSKHITSADLFARTGIPLLVLSSSEYKVYTATGKPCIRIKDSYLGDHALYLPISVTKVSGIQGKYLCLYSEDKYLKVVFGTTIPDILRQLGKRVEKEIYATCYVDKSSHRTFFHHLKLFHQIQSNFIKSMPNGDSIRNDKSFRKFADICGDVFKNYKPKPNIPLTSFIFLYDEIQRDPSAWTDTKSIFKMVCRIEVGKIRGKFVDIDIISRTLKFSIECLAPFMLESQSNILLTISYESGNCKLIAERYNKTHNEDQIKILKEYV